MSQISPEITHKDIRKLSRQFRDFACRLLRTDVDDGVDNLLRFLDYINNNPLINDYIQFQVKESGLNFSEQDLISSSIPINIAGEINFTYSLLMNFASDEHLHSSSYFNLAYNYLAHRGGVGSSKMQNCVDEFNKRVIHPFVNHIEQYLSELSIDLSPSNQSNIIHNSGTLNHISGQNINAVQGSDNNGVIGDHNH